MKITNVRINGIENPLGYCMEGLTCSWNVCDTVSKKQTNAVIEVSTSADFEEDDILYRVEGSSVEQGGEYLEDLELDLTPRMIYYYRVCVTGDAGDEAVSETQTFETGKMDEPWTADWIAAQKEDTFHPVMTKSFSLKGEVARARLYISGVGMFEAYLNGEKLGEEYLTPYVNNYETNIQVITFPVEECLKAENTLEIMLGKGWYMSVFGLALQANNYGDRMAAIAELHVEYADGTDEVIATDGSWEYYGSDIEDSGIYLGETLNRQLWKAGSASPQGAVANSDALCARKQDGNPKKPVEVLTDPTADEGTKNLVKSHLMDRISIPVLVKESIPVKEVIQTPAGETVLDFGQNFAGFVEFKAELPAGTKVVLDCGEILQKGNFYNGNYRDAQSRFIYVSDGRKETVRPHFTFFGFRYIRVTGWVGELKAEDFIGRVLYSDIRRTGFITTSNEKINRLYENTVWGLKSNFIDMPTDCPQRSERLGWTGDAQVFAPTASYHMDTRAFFHKFIKDLKDEQEYLSGGMPNFLPNMGHQETAGSVWGDIATFLPYTMYTYYGDKKELEYCYPMMKGWVDYIDRQDAKRGRTYLFDFMDTFGDWLALDGPTPSSFKGSTDDTYVSTLYYYRSTQMVREMAEVLGKTEDAAHYGDLEEKIEAAIYNEFFTPSGRLAINTQSAAVIAMKFGLGQDREKLKAQFRARLQQDLNQIKGGFVGAPLLCTVLAEAGMVELAYDFLLKEGFPSWLYSVNLGATTIWERWNSVFEDGTISDTGMNSLNHYSYGSVMEFVYAYVAGIRPLTPGFKSAILAPHPDIRIPKVDCTYDSVNGKYVSNWEICADGRLKVHLEIPFNCEAEVELPGYDAGAASAADGANTRQGVDSAANFETGNAAAAGTCTAANGAGISVNADGKMVLTAGAYDFLYQPTVDYRKPYTRQTTLGRLAQDPNAIGILGKYTPALAGIAMSGNPEMAANSLEALSHMGFLPFEPAALETAIKEITELVVVPA
ncbi:MAG: glycoside hydrolase family 78 protein [Lachnospiraceae bacterium]|nr:glycoside hydrolase family 78 protein [Lachnospiraceae bacterium]